MLKGFWTPVYAEVTMSERLFPYKSPKKSPVQPAPVFPGRGLSGLHRLYWNTIKYAVVGVAGRGNASRV
jgi:hypothetical protein